jgi:hypothetical protein
MLLLCSQGVWGGEYFVPLDEKPAAAPYITLQSKQIGDLNSLTWIETPAPITSGIPVTVSKTVLFLMITAFYVNVV